ncbi:MAG: DUF2877 domain-containing protein [Marmoricola sp.]
MTANGFSATGRPTGSGTGAPPPIPMARRPPRRLRTVFAVGGARLRERLDGPHRETPILHRGRDAIYLEDAGWCLGVVTRSATHVPCALVLAGAAAVDLSTVDRAEVGDGSVVLHAGRLQVAVRLGRLANLLVPRLRSAPPSYVVERMLGHARVAVDELGDPSALRRQVMASPSRLLGRGSGLTPLGDDVLAGWAAASVALGLPSTGPDPRERTTLLSATLLDCARRGEVLPEFRALVLALAAPNELRGVDKAARALAAVGHTSGAGMLLGACLRLDGDHNR